MARSSIELFSDYFAQTENTLTRIDARVKMVFVFACLLLVITTINLSVLLLMSALCISTLIAVKIPYRIVLVRLAGPLFMATVILIINGLFYGEKPIFILNFKAFNIYLFEEGISRGLLVAGRVITGTSLVIFLSMTTRLNELLSALKFFKVPELWLTIIAFTYRYIFVFVEEAQNIMHAQSLRLGYSKAMIGLRSWGMLVGSLFTRVYDQANSTHEAMVLRGYRGVFYIRKPNSMTRYDLNAAIVMAVIFLILLELALGWG